MPAFCVVTAEIIVNGEVVKSKSWPKVDIMKTSVSREWATRQFNAFLKDFAICDIGKDNFVRVEWIARYGESQGYGSVSGWKSGVKWSRDGSPRSVRGLNSYKSSLVSFLPFAYDVIWKTESH
jgi:hypothetical protein